MDSYDITCQRCGCVVLRNDIVQTVEVVGGETIVRYEVQCPGCGATDTIGGTK